MGAPLPSFSVAVTAALSLVWIRDGAEKLSVTPPLLESGGVDDATKQRLSPTV
jgi:hypothetical protein